MGEYGYDRGYRRGRRGRERRGILPINDRILNILGAVLGVATVLGVGEIAERKWGWNDVPTMYGDGLKAIVAMVRPEDERAVDRLYLPMTKEGVTPERGMYLPMLLVDEKVGLQMDFISVVQDVNKRLTSEIGSEFEQIEIPKSWERATTMGVYSGESLTDQEIGWINSIWKVVDGLREGTDPVSEHVVMKDWFVDVVPVTARWAEEGEGSKTEFGFGPRTDKKLGADLSVVIDKVVDFSKLGKVADGIEVDDDRVQKILDIYNELTWEHEKAHFQSLLIGFVDTLEMSGADEKKPVDLAEPDGVRAVSDLMESSREYHSQMGNLLEFGPHLLDYVGFELALINGGYEVEYRPSKITLPDGIEIEMLVPVVSFSGQEIAKMTEYGMVMEANFFHQQMGVDRDWMIKYAGDPLTSLPKAVTNGFLRMYGYTYGSKFGVGLDGQKEKQLSRGGSKIEDRDIEHKNSEETESVLPSGIVLYGYNMGFDDLLSSDGSVAMMCGGIPGTGLNEFEMGNRIDDVGYYETDPLVGSVIFSGPDGYAHYTFYHDLDTKEILMKVVNLIKPGDQVEFKTMDDGDSCSNVLLWLKVNGEELYRQAEVVSLRSEYKNTNTSPRVRQAQQRWTAWQRQGAVNTSWQATGRVG